MKTVFLFIRNAMFMSDLLQTDYIKYLSQKYKVVVLTPFVSGAEQAKKEGYFVSRNVVYKKWNTKNVKLLAKFKFLRTAAMRELNFVSSIDIFYKSNRFLRDKRSRLVRWLTRPFKPLLTNSFLTKLESMFIRMPSEFSQLVEEYNPSLIITSTPGIQLFEAEVILLARKLAIPTLATNFSWDNLMSFKSSRIRRPDYLFCWNDIIKRSALDIHKFDPKKVFVTGSMRFDSYFKEYTLPKREEFLRSKGLDPKNPTILFATATRGFSYSFTVLKEILDMREKKEIPYVNILLRLHPIDEINDYKEFKGIDNFYIEEAGKKIATARGGEVVQMSKYDFINLRATLAHTDININFKSTISLESLLLDKPVINYLDPTKPLLNKIYYDDNSYYRPFVKEGAVKVSKNKNDLKVFINEYLENPNLDSEARKKVAQMYVPYRDGESYKRNVDLIGEIM